MFQTDLAALSVEQFINLIICDPPSPTKQQKQGQKTVSAFTDHTCHHYKLSLVTLSTHL